MSMAELSQQYCTMLFKALGMGGVVQEIQALSWTAAGQHKLTIHITLKTKLTQGRPRIKNQGRRESCFSIHFHICTDFSQTAGTILCIAQLPHIFRKKKYLHRIHSILTS